MNFTTTTTTKAIEIQVFLEQIFLNSLSFHFSELNYYSALFRLLFFFEVQKFELLGLALPCQ